ncbi:hypothetical protein CC86DRAFT_301372, partial [Ophiobolus disseminans]
LFNDSLFSDLTIHQISKGITKSYPSHKAILCPGSGWFKKALTGNFKVQLFSMSPNIGL